MQCPGLSHLADSENPLRGFFLCLDLRLFFSLFVVCLQGGCAVELGSFPWLQPEGDFLVSRWAARKYLEQEYPQGLHRSFSEEETGLLGMLPHSRIQTGTTPKMCQEHFVSSPTPHKENDNDWCVREELMAKVSSHQNFVNVRLASL